MKAAVVVLAIIVVIALVVLSVARRKTPQLTEDDVQAGILELSEAAVVMAESDYGRKLGYSVESVEQVEEILGQMHEAYRRQELPNEAVTQTAVRYGAYVGEVIRREWGGSWEQDHEVAGPGSFPLKTFRGESFPINWCYKRLTNGPEDNVSHKLQALFLAQGGITFHPDGSIEEN